MSERKNIDRLFQERFEDFEATPMESAWSNIEAKLDEKKKRRIIPFWWKLTGVAAVFLIGLLLVMPGLQPEIKTKNAVVIETNAKDTEAPEIIKNTKKNSDNVKPDIKDNSETLFNNSAIKEKNNVAEKKINNASEEKNKTRIVSQSTQTKVAQNKTKTSRLLNERCEEKHINNWENNSLITEKSSQIADSDQNKNIIQTDNNLTKNNSSPINKSINLDELKDATNANSKIVTTEKKVNDTTKINGVTTNALEELLNEKESKTKQKSKESRWLIASNVTPVFLGSVTNGSPIDPSFEDNSKTYNTSFSFGVGVCYALNNKYSVRTGINKMSFDYNTNGIAFYASIDSNTITNISASANNTPIIVEDANQINNALLPFENDLINKNKGYLNQKLGYYEVPLELTYSLINKRFGVKIIGGISTFFLDENSITAVSDTFSTDLGKANNLNDVHFSTNLGFGLKYGFMKSFEFSVEPTIKYQLNTFSSNSGNFKPYVYGIYSGISYKF